MLQADRSTWTGRGLSVLGGLSWCVVPGWSPNGNVAGESIQATKQSSRVAHTHSAFIFETLAKQEEKKCYRRRYRGDMSPVEPKSKRFGMEFGSEGSEEGKVVRSMIGQLPKLHCSEGKDK